MKRMCRGRGLLIVLIAAACLTTGVLLIVGGRPGRQAAAQEAADEQQESVGDQIRRLATEGLGGNPADPQAAVALAAQYLAAHPAPTMERQRVHYELAASQWFSGDEGAALATFRQILAQYANAGLDTSSAEYRVDDAVYFIGVLEGGKGDEAGRAAAVTAYRTLIANFPESNRRPRAMFDLGGMYIEDGKPELGIAMLRSLVEQHPASEYAPAAIRAINARLLDPAAWSSDEARAQNVATATANVGILTASYPASPDTSQAWQDLLWYYNCRGEIDGAKAIARQMIQLYLNADVAAAGNALYPAALTELDFGDRAVGLAALVRFVSTHPGTSCPPGALGRLACLRAEDADGNPGALDQGRALAQVLATGYAETDQEAEALRCANRYWLSKEANPTKADRAANFETVQANIDTLMAKYPASPETCAAHQEVLWHFGYEHFEYAEAEPWARLIIERFPGTWAAADATIDLAAFIVEMRRDFAEAYPLIDEAIAWAQEQADWSLVAAALHVKGRSMTKEQRYADAREELARLLAFIDDHPEGEWLRVQTEAERAATYIEEGSMLLSRGDKETAKARLMKGADEYAAALERHPDDAGWAPYLKHQIGLAYMLAGEEDAAKQAFVRLVVEHPDNGWAWVAFDYMDLGMERPERPATVRMGGEDEQ